MLLLSSFILGEVVSSLKFLGKVEGKDKLVWEFGMMMSGKIDRWVLGGEEEAGCREAR